MKLHHIESSPMLVNTYILMDEAAGEAAVIDPGFHNHKLFEYLASMPCKVKYIIATHGHGDHTALMGRVKQDFGGQIVIHEADAPFLASKSQFSLMMGGSYVRPEPDILLKGGERLTVGSLTLEVIHTPGHSKGGICLLCPPYLFTGDTLFHDDVGRTDFDGGSHEELRHSIAVVLGRLEGDYQVLPGHEEFSTLSYEKANNPFFKPL